MGLTKSELLTALQNEARILMHLIGKIDHSAIDYRPTPKQRSTLELLISQHNGADVIRMPTQATCEWKAENEARTRATSIRRLP